MVATGVPFRLVLPIQINCYRRVSVVGVPIGDRCFPSRVKPAGGGVPTASSRKAPETKPIPVAPVAPVGPVAPVAPVAPVNPIGPVGPVRAISSICASCTSRAGAGGPVGPDNACQCRVGR